MSLPPPPPNIDLSDDDRPQVVAVPVITWALAFLMVVLRMVGRRLRYLPLWYDDWLIIFSLMPALGHVIGIAGYAVSRGFGQHVWAAKPDGVYAWALGLFIAEICYTLTLVSVKLSILAFYWRSFSVRNSIKLPIWVLVAIVSCWGVAVLLVTFLQCLPTRAAWERFNPNHTMDQSEYNCGADPMKFFYGNAIPTIATDLMMLALPVPYIWRLQLPRIQKIALGCVFLVGIFVTIVSTVRFVFLIQTDLTDPDITWNFVSVGIWSIVEGNIAIVCACLPFLKPILSKSSFGLRHWGSVPNKSKQSDISGKSSGNHKEHFRTWGVDRSLGSSTTHVKSLNRDLQDGDEEPLARGSDDLSIGDPARQSEMGIIELTDMPHSLTPPPTGIMVTRGVHQRHQSAT